MKHKSSRAKEPAALWIRRKEASARVLDPLIQARDKYRIALSLLEGIQGPFGRSSTKAAGTARVESSKQSNVRFSYRYMRWLMSQGMGEKPLIRTSRDASPDEIVGEMADILLMRVLEEGNAFEEWRQTYPDKCWLGSSTVWYGYHAIMSSAQGVADASEPVESIVERALNGDPEAKPGQDHQLVAASLRAAADEMDDTEAMELLHAAAQSHDKMLVDGAGDSNDVRVVDRTIWFKRAVPGENTFWDAQATDPSDIEWMMQKVTVRLEDAKKDESLIASARARLKGTAMDIKREADRPKNSTTTTGIDGVEDETKRVILFYFWDKRYNVRHIISPELPDEYLEADESNPYAIDGDNLIPGFFPCGYSAPELPPIDGPERVAGMPLVAPGWEAEKDADKFARMMVEDADKHTRRDYVLHPDIQNPEEIRDGLRGPTGAVMQAKGLVDGQEAITPISFRGSTGEILQQFREAEARWVKAQGMPMAELSSQPQADTATQEQLGVAAGRQEAEDIIKQDERAFANMVEGVRGLVRGLYSDDKVAALLGPKFTQPEQEGQPSKFELWSASALDGDRLEIKFGSRVFKDDAVRISQIQKTIGLLSEYTGPMGLPLMDLRPYYMELTRKLDMGTPIEVAPEVMQMRQLVETLVQQIEELKEQAAQAHAEGKREAQQKAAGNNKPGPAKSASGTGKTTTGHNQNSAARRGTSTAS